MHFLSDPRLSFLPGRVLGLHSVWFSKPNYAYPYGYAHGYDYGYGNGRKTNISSPSCLDRSAMSVPQALPLPSASRLYISIATQKWKQIYFPSVNLLLCKTCHPFSPYCNHCNTFLHCDTWEIYCFSWQAPGLDALSLSPFCRASPGQGRGHRQQHGRWSWTGGRGRFGHSKWGQMEPLCLCRCQSCSQCCH